jgi:hypothetical protein
VTPVSNLLIYSYTSNKTIPRTSQTHPVSRLKFRVVGNIKTDRKIFHSDMNLKQTSATVSVAGKPSTCRKPNK